jgi:hypothetical protein
MQNKYDVFRLKLVTIEGEEKIIDMTPDEAAEISSILTTMLQFYLYETDKFAKLKFKDKRVKCNT